MFFAPPNAAQSHDDETDPEIFDLFVENTMSQSIQIAAVTDLPAGASKLVEVNRTRIALFNLDGEIYAIEDVCTHDGGPLVEGKLVNGCQIQCPRHGARFDLRTGADLSFPAFEPTRTYAVQIREGLIWIEL